MVQHIHFNNKSIEMIISFFLIYIYYLFYCKKSVIVEDFDKTGLNLLLAFRLSHHLNQHLKQ